MAKLMIRCDHKMGNLLSMSEMQIIVIFLLPSISPSLQLVGSYVHKKLGLEGAKHCGSGPPFNPSVARASKCKSKGPAMPLNPTLRS